MWFDIVGKGADFAELDEHHLAVLCVESEAVEIGAIVVPRCVAGQLIAASRARSSSRTL
jgi:hypothetical protein